MLSPGGADGAAVLLVDDRADKRLALLTLLGDSVETVTAASGQEALQHLSARRYAVVLMDVHMPGMDGFETARRIRLQEGSSDTPVIFVTADDRDAEAAYALGAVDFLRPPLSAPVLRAKVAAFIELHRRRQEITLLNRALEQRVAELSELNEELEAFSFSVSHDLRAPVRHIAGFAQLLRKRTAGRLDEQSARYLTHVTDAAARMGLLIDDLLAFSRTSRQEIARTSVDLGRVVADAREALAPELAQRDVEWDVGPLPRVIGDPRLLHVVFVNLLGNAVKYTRGRKPAHVVVRGDTDGARARVQVQDDGVGFDMRHADKLFGVFQRLHSSEEFEGTGIGLATVRRIVHRHGGTVTAVSTPGQGSTFTLVLPASPRT